MTEGFFCVTRLGDLYLEGLNFGTLRHLNSNMTPRRSGHFSILVWFS